MNRSTAATDYSGFTLLELLVAVAVFAVSATLAYGAYLGVLDTSRRVEAGSSLQERAVIVFDQIRRDLHGVYKGESGYFRTVEDGSPEDARVLLTFTSSASLAFNPTIRQPSLAVVGYHLAGRPDGDTRSLTRADRPLSFAFRAGSEAHRHSHILCENVVRISFTFVDRYGTVLDRWEARSGAQRKMPDDDRFPALVMIELVLADDEPGDGAQRSFRTAVHLPPATIEGIRDDREE